ncbi:hypothetical protein HCA69_12540 [Listeria grandensis]|uniref:Uncharacterized protein n=1 Tax=Listeria grandensis TaxID=1494963 RepID=A0A7X0Y543_9LIST|nr:hypothetical protein [Listeria grandensis]MBC1937201.1 hypothetical protein [Listeria grandensis]
MNNRKSNIPQAIACAETIKVLLERKEEDAQPNEREFLISKMGELLSLLKNENTKRSELSNQLYEVVSQL